MTFRAETARACLLAAPEAVRALAASAFPVGDNSLPGTKLVRLFGNPFRFAERRTRRGGREAAGDPAVY